MKFNRKYDDLKGVNTNMGTAIYSAVPHGEVGKCSELQGKFQALVFRF